MSSDAFRFHSRRRLGALVLLLAAPFALLAEDAPAPTAEEASRPEEGVEAPAEGGLEAQVEYRILEYDPRENYGPMVGRLTDVIRAKLDVGTGSDEFSISHDDHRIFVEIKTLTDEVFELKDRLQTLVTALPATDFKGRLALGSLKIQISRRHQRAEGKARKKGAKRAMAARETDDPGRPDQPILRIVAGPPGPDGTPHYQEVQAKDIPVQKLVLLLSRLSKVNVVLRPEAVYQPVNIFLREVSLETLLRALAESSCIEFAKRDDYYILGKGLDPVPAR